MRENGLDRLGISEPWRICATPEVLDAFALPFIAGSEEQQLLDRFRMEVDKKYSVGLVIGRFQPLHYGHIFLIKQALAITRYITIGIGSSNVQNADNPWSVHLREQRLMKTLVALGIQNRVIKIVRLNDYMQDDFWLAETLKKTGEVDVVIGNNDWVNGIFERWNYPVITTPLYHRECYEGKKIRHWLRNVTTL